MADEWVRERFELSSDEMHDLISRYCQWPPYHQRPVVTEKVTQVMTAEEYASEFGFRRKHFNDIPAL